MFRVEFENPHISIMDETDYHKFNGNGENTVKLLEFLISSCVDNDFTDVGNIYIRKNDNEVKMQCILPIINSSTAQISQARLDLVIDTFMSKYESVFEEIGATIKDIKYISFKIDNARLVSTPSYGNMAVQDVFHYFKFKSDFKKFYNKLDKDTFISNILVFDLTKYDEKWTQDEYYATNKFSELFEPFFNVSNDDIKFFNVKKKKKKK